MTMIWLALALLAGIAAGLPAGVWLSSGIFAYPVVWALVKQRAAAVWRQWSGRE